MAESGYRPMSHSGATRGRHLHAVAVRAILRAYQRFLPPGASAGESVGKCGVAAGG